MLGMTYVAAKKNTVGKTDGSTGPVEFLISGNIEDYFHLHDLYLNRLAKLIGKQSVFQLSSFSRQSTNRGWTNKGCVGERGISHGLHKRRKHIVDGKTSLELRRPVLADKFNQPRYMSTKSRRTSEIYLTPPGILSHEVRCHY